MPANNRFSDNPFRDPTLTPEQVERIEKRNEALRIYRETGNEGPAIEIGLFPARPTKLLSYMKMEFPVTRTAPHSASITSSVIYTNTTNSRFRLWTWTVDGD